MDAASLFVQALNGLAAASSLFLVAAGLSLIFGVTRIVNFAHGSFFMLGVYVAYSLVSHAAPSVSAALSMVLGDAAGQTTAYFLMLMCAALVTGLLGALVEVLLLRRIYKAPELFQLLATFALVLVIQDSTLWLWGAEDLLGPRAPGLSSAVDILGRRFPTYDLFLIAIGPLVLALLWWCLQRTRFGVLVRAATQDREMLGALGVNPRHLFTAVFALGCALAGLGGALQLPREPAHLGLDMATIGDAFVVVVVGGMGSIPGAFVAALLIAEIKALCIAVGTIDILGVSFAFSKLTLVVEFLVMAAVLMVRPWGLLGKPQSAPRISTEQEAPFTLGSVRSQWVWLCMGAALLALPLFTTDSPYTLVLGIDLLIAALFAASLHFIMGPAGMHSFGHAAYFGVGAYAAALLVLRAGMSSEAALLLAPLVSALVAAPIAWFAVRLSGVYLAMLTLAFAQIVWSICFQWDDFTGGSNGITGVWPSDWLQDKSSFYWLTLALVTASVIALRRVLMSPLGYALRASRDSVGRAEAMGLNVAHVQWLGFVVAAGFAGLAGALFAFSKGSISPDVLGVSKSVDGLVMVMLGGVHTLVGPLVGAVTFTALQDSLARSTDYWRAVLGGSMLLLVLVFPQGIAGSVQALWQRLRGSYASEKRVAA
ncbi:MAG: ABC transporter permease [Burkholderiales bacterium 35-55-47]|jgi:branched-chain amino acid transport system permease protein|uniref:ABC transporter permease n=1 Tax=Limnohabitans sp. TaxID=1907725 RepID=UPI000BD0D762|nr:ABC transporter permease [Limnohabitans sp.]OYY18366.1 MAG: ABC transporter permease [Burkholderiales bacterium 35-55-47]OYZ72779.1 MAG: ABC transporter permease [Burkholderiales bacterium 24-55-52]OZA99201.1 MAG: ABC transporter permease [Burkholderiales bacterium 39-55-53]HQR87152.1 ABC transporter permease [Limnohabitans sp.]HQS27800.1 ABC transporter permease [Limnohabitans sp.]